LVFQQALYASRGRQEVSRGAYTQKRREGRKGGDKGQMNL